MGKKMTCDQFNELQLDTVGQFDSVLYCKIKKLRLTSTCFQEVIAMVKNGKKNTLTAKENKMKSLLFPSNKDTFTAVQWGMYHEETAKHDFETLTNLKVFLI